MAKQNYFIQDAVKLHPHRVRNYIAREFGKKAFAGANEKKGKIKTEYFKKAYNKVMGEKGDLSLKRAFELGKRFKSNEFRHRA
jgi:hypothetical protein